MQASHCDPPQTGLFQNRNFMLLWCAYGVSAIGDHLSEMAILKTQDALNPNVDITPLSARITFFFFVPFLLLSPIAGSLADRYSRRALMVIADLARAAIVFELGWLIGVASKWFSWDQFLPLTAVGIFAAFFSPARMAVLPTLIAPKQLVRANGMIGGLGIIATMIAAVIGGKLADTYPASVAFRLDAATFAASAVLLLCMRPPSGEQTVSPKKGALKEIADGFRYVLAHYRVRELLVVAALVWFCGPLINSVIPAVVRDVYGGTYTLISVYRGLLGLGFIIGAAIIISLGDALRSQIVMTWGLFGIGLGMGFLALSVVLPLNQSALMRIGGVGIVLAGASALGVMASFQTLLQRIVANRFRGRVFGVNDLICTFSLLIATGMLGIPNWERLDQWAGLIVGTVAIVTLLAGVIVLYVRLHRGPHGWALNLGENLNEFIVKFWYRFQRIGRPTVPRTGSVIVTSNHISAADPLLLCAAAPYRAISFMIAAEYARWPIVNFFVRALECIPVRRGTRETGATKQALRHLEQGRAVGIFIEGGIPDSGEIARPKDGVAMMALKTGATVVPAYISGMTLHQSILRSLFSRQNARVRWGPSVNLDEFRSEDTSRENIRAATAKIYAAVLALAPKAGVNSAQVNPPAGASGTSEVGS